MEQLTERQIENWKKQIDGMCQEDLARLWRFAYPGHPVFREDLPLYAYFKFKFKGFTPEISKAIGWDE